MSDSLDPMDCSTPDFPVLHYLLEFAQTDVYLESMTPSNHLILYFSLLLVPSIFPSIRVNTIYEESLQSEKAGLKLSIQKTKIMASVPITSWQIKGEKVEAMIDFIFLGFKITALTAAMNLKDTYSLEEKP